MNRKLKSALFRYSIVALALVVYIGCKGYQIGHILKPDASDMVGSHAAGSATFNPLVDEAVQKLLTAAEANEKVQLSSPQLPPQVNVCFVGIENSSAEELGDFREQLREKIDTMINNHPLFNSISENYVKTGLRLTRLKPTELFIPDNMRNFAATMEQHQQPFQYLLFAKLTSGTTQKNNSQQRDYLLSLSLVDMKTGQQVKQTAEVRKGYHTNAFARISNYNPFKKK